MTKEELGEALDIEGPEGEFAMMDSEQTRDFGRLYQLTRRMMSFIWSATEGGIG